MNATKASALPIELAPILDTVIDAVIILSKDGRIAGWNHVAQATFGWASDEAVGAYLSDLIVPHEHRAAHQEGMARLKQGGDPRVLSKRIEMPALTKDGRIIPVELSITTSRGTGREFFIGFLRDISARRNAEELLQLKLREYEVMLEVTRMASEANSFDDAMSTVLETICDLTDWQVGHAFVVDRNNDELLLASMIWHECEPGRADKMKKASEGLSFRVGEGLPGAVLATGSPVWLSDINLEGNFIRKGCDFRGAFGFPLKSAGKVIAVLEFFSASPTAPDKSQLLLAQALGEQLGRVIERSETYEQREVLLHELNHRNKNLLTVVQSLAQTTFAGMDGAKARLQTFMSRISAMARAQDLLVHEHWSDSNMQAVVDTALSGFEAYRDRITVSGPKVKVSASEVQSNVLTIHELCTNAIKHGAFQHDDGRIVISWGYEGVGGTRKYFFDWRETGAQITDQPEHKGFGTSLLRRGLSNSSNAEIISDYMPDGLHYRLTTIAPE